MKSFAAVVITLLLATTALGHPAAPSPCNKQAPVTTTEVTEQHLYRRQPGAIAKTLGAAALVGAVGLGATAYAGAKLGNRAIKKTKFKYYGLRTNRIHKRLQKRVDQSNAAAKAQQLKTQ
ncbi:hypothetical protein IWQ60_001814 [Tieghemiomyces parasiticus]|uniref:Uncharacterized protein n=1 Tax=Tieghemiomyces parasiticus TaxID=78921 RepID=A0A9W8AKJ0_9FUNG|nr:hypothetical protein IWQ60_001814 [Tieghemiomyces parasiticus]